MGTSEVDQDWQPVEIDLADADVYAADDAASEPPPSILQAERRIHVRAYNRWAALKKGRAFPHTADLDAPELAEFGPRAVLLRYATPASEPEILFIGRALREEAGMDGESLPALADTPPGSLVQRLASRHREIASHRAPVGIEAEFAGLFGEATLYRGVMLPFSSDGQEIDHIYGVVNWRMAAPGDLPAEIHGAVEQARTAPMARVTGGRMPFPVAAEDDGRARLRDRLPMATLPADDLPFTGEFVLLVARREPDGQLAVVATLPADEATLARVTADGKLRD